MGGSAQRNRLERDGIIVLTLLLVPLGAVVAGAVLTDLDALGLWVALVSGAFVPSSSWLAWLGLRGGRSDAGTADGLVLEHVAERLAAAVKAQWQTELGRRRLNEPYALPVRWRPVGAGWVEAWPLLLRTAGTDGVGWPHPPVSGWAAGPAELAGSGRELAEVVRRVPTGRLVVLGEPGAGKTILLVRLLSDLLARPEPGDPVPVLLPLASWDPTSEDLFSWMEARIITDHAGFSQPAPDGSGVTRVRALLDAGRIMPVLDGLDELPEPLRLPAISQINAAVRPGQRLVVAARRAEYEAVVRSGTGAEQLISGAAGVELCPLAASEIVVYLRDTAGGAVAAARWDPVLAAVGGRAAGGGWVPTVYPVAEAFTTPLAAGLARTIYNPRPDERDGVVPDPSELLDPSRFPDRDAVVRHLFDKFVPAAYRPSPQSGERQARWSAEDAERWLTFLARHLEHNLRGTTDLAWWQLPAAVSRRRRDWLGVRTAALGWLVLTVAFALLLQGFVWRNDGRTVSTMFDGLWLLVITGVGSAFVVLLGWGGFRSVYHALRGPVGWENRSPARALRWRLDRRTVLCSVACAAGTVVFTGTVLWQSARDGEHSLPAVGVAVSTMIVLGLVAGGSYLTFAGLAVGDVQVHSVSDPDGLRADDRFVFWVLAGVIGLAVGLSTWLVLVVPWLVAGFALVPGWAVVALVVAAFPATAVGFGAAAARTVSVPFVMARRVLVRRRQLPKEVMAFLADAHQERGVLRQVGAVYQFRHLELQRQLAGTAHDPSADRLADRLEHVWRTELRHRLAGGPQMDLRWSAADPALALALAQPWDQIVRAAMDWRKDVSHTASRPSALSGGGTSLAATYRRTPAGRLVVLGEAGTGKTLLLVRLLLDLLASRRSGEPVPILVRVASWQPQRHDLVDWLDKYVPYLYPWLGRKAAGVTSFRAMVNSGRVVLLLDGLDEMSEADRRHVIPALNESLANGTPFVLASRPDAFGDAVQPADAVAVHLTAAAVIELEPVQAKVAHSFLATGLDPASSTAAGWNHVFAMPDAIPATTTAVRALCNPLAASRARAVYTPPPDSGAAYRRNPAELCDLSRYPTADAVADHLLDSFVRTAYRRDSDVPPPRWNARQAERHLMLLAYHLENRLGGSVLAWWELDAFIPKALATALHLLPFGLAGASAVFTYSPASPYAVLGGLGSMLLAIATIFALYRQLPAGMPPGMMTMISWVDERRPILTPHDSIVRERQEVLLLTIAGIPALTITGVLASRGRMSWPEAAQTWGLVALAMAMIRPWSTLCATRIFLTVRYGLPLRIIEFLEDARDRGVLRQTATTWEFTHRYLQQRLAERQSGRRRSVR